MEGLAHQFCGVQVYASVARLDSVGAPSFQVSSAGLISACV
jgi:hypothetical protein